MSIVDPCLATKEHQQHCGETSSLRVFREKIVSCAIKSTGLMLQTLIVLLFKVAAGKRCWHVAGDHSPVCRMMADLVVTLSGRCRELSARAVCLVLRQNHPVNLAKAFLCLLVEQTRTAAMLSWCGGAWMALRITAEHNWTARPCLMKLGNLLLHSNNGRQQSASVCWQ